MLVETCDYLVTFVKCWLKLVIIWLYLSNVGWNLWLSGYICQMLVETCDYLVVFVKCWLKLVIIWLYLSNVGWNLWLSGCICRRTGYKWGRVLWLSGCICRRTGYKWGRVYKIDNAIQCSNNNDFTMKLTTWTESCQFTCLSG